MDLTRTELKEQAESMGLYFTWYSPGAGSGAMNYKFSHVDKDYHALTHWETLARVKGLKLSNYFFSGYKAHYFKDERV